MWLPFSDHLCHLKTLSQASQTLLVTTPARYALNAMAVPCRPAERGAQHSNSSPLQQVLEEPANAQTASLLEACSPQIQEAYSALISGLEVRAIQSVWMLHYLLHGTRSMARVK